MVSSETAQIQLTNGPVHCCNVPNHQLTIVLGGQSVEVMWSREKGSEDELPHLPLLFVPPTLPFVGQWSNGHVEPEEGG